MLKSVVKHLLAKGSGSAGENAHRIIHDAPDRRLGEGLNHQTGGRLREAEQLYRSVLSDDPKHTDASHLLGYVLKLQKRYSEAVEVFSRLTALAPHNAEAWFGLGDALRAQRRLTGAAEAFRRTLALKPDFPAALVSLADILVILGQLDEAEDAYLQALQLQRGLAEAHFNYGNLLHRQGRITEATTSYRRALDLKPDFVRAHSNLVYALNFSSDHTPEEIFREHLEWARRYGAPMRRFVQPHRNSREIDRLLRVGYVSADFRDHAVNYLFEPVMRYHDRTRFRVYCYSNVLRPDAYTARLREYKCIWRDIAGQSDEAVSQLIRGDEIDILVDLSGHTAAHRLLVFARKPAPVQVTWIGYPNTTGLEVMDYRLSDAFADPPGMTEHLHTEQLVRLPEIYVPFQPPDDSPAVNHAPVLSRGHVTFGSFNSLAKLTPKMIGIWSRILRALPTARLMILSVPEGETRVRLRAAFEHHDVSPERLDLKGRLPSEEFLAAYHLADIALDSFPYHGTTTTCYTLWMGVPIITLAGRSHVARVGVSMLSNLGLERLIARNEQEYVSLAVALAQDPRELATLRASLRERMLASPNTDGARVTRFLEAAYAKMWKDYCVRADT